MKKTFTIILSCCIFAGTLTGCLGSKKTKYQRTTYFYFDTSISFISYATSEEKFEELWSFVKGRFEIYHRYFDIYNLYDGVNNLATINNEAGGDPLNVEPEIIELLELAVEWYQKSDGLFDITKGNLYEVWSQYRTYGMSNPEDAYIPSQKELENAASHGTIEDIVIDKEAKTVQLKDPYMSLNVGAIAKGYATEKVTQELIAKGYTDFAINAGGNVRTVGKPLDKRAWSVGLQNPDLSGPSVDTLYTNNLSVVTSGSYQRFFTVDDMRYHHLINPKTLWPENYYHSVTILTEDSGLADILSTVAFLMPFEESYDYIESLEGVEAIWILYDEDSTIEFTPGAAQYMESQGAKAE